MKDESKEGRNKEGKEGRTKEIRERMFYKKAKTMVVG